jgi:hypothetical protein
LPLKDRVRSSIGLQLSLWPTFPDCSAEAAILTSVMRSDYEMIKEYGAV